MGIEEHLISQKGRGLLGLFQLGGTFGPRAAATKATTEIVKPSVLAWLQTPGASVGAERERLEKILSDIEEVKSRPGRAPMTRWMPLCVTNICCATGRRGAGITASRLASFGLSRYGGDGRYVCIAMRLWDGKALGSNMSETDQSKKNALGTT